MPEKQKISSRVSTAHFVENNVIALENDAASNKM